MTEKIFALARTLSGAGAAEEPLLEALCRSAEQLWRDRVPAETADCEEALICAAAYTAAADLTAGRGGGVASFTAGDISVKREGGGERLAAAQALRQTAERLMAPYTAPGDVCLKGVRG